MVHAAEKHDTLTLTSEAWLCDARSAFDVGATLTAALTPGWLVEREVDPSGDLSVIVAPVRDTAAHPTFILYEENGMVQVSMFFGEHWQSRRAFRTCQRAVSAIIAAAQTTGLSDDQDSSVSLTARASSSVR